jgi:DNA-binding response OmpR family regulator
MALGPGWQFDEAVDGLVGIEKATASPFDLVVADELTEPYGAFGLARELKILPEPPAVIVLLDRAQDSWLAKWSGADRWLVRPIDPFELSACALELARERDGRAPATSTAE